MRHAEEGGVEALADVAQNYTRFYFDLEGRHGFVSKVYYGLPGVEDRNHVYDPQGLGLGQFNWIESEFTIDKFEMIGMAYDRLVNVASGIARQNH